MLRSRIGSEIVAARYRMLMLTTLALGMMAGPVLAQSPSPDFVISYPPEPAIRVVATSTGIYGLPVSIPDNAPVWFENGTDGQLLIDVARRNDGVTESWPRILADPSTAPDKVGHPDGFEPFLLRPREIGQPFRLRQTGDYYVLVIAVPTEMAGAYVIVGQQELAVTTGDIGPGPVPSGGLPVPSPWPAPSFETSYSEPPATQSPGP